MVIVLVIMKKNALHACMCKPPSLAASTQVSKWVVSCYLMQIFILVGQPNMLNQNDIFWGGLTRSKQDHGKKYSLRSLNFNNSFDFFPSFFLSLFSNKSIIYCCSFFRKSVICLNQENEDKKRDENNCKYKEKYS